MEGRPATDYQISLLEAGGHAVEILEARRNPGEPAGGFLKTLDVFERRPQDLLDPDEALSVVALSNAEYPLLGQIHDLLDGALSLVVDVPDDVGCRGDKPPEQRLVADDSGVVLDVGRGRDSVEQLGKVGGPTSRFELTRVLELFIQRDHVDDIPALEEAHHASEESAVGLPMEHGVVDDLDRFRHRVVVDQHTAEDRDLGLQRVRQLPIMIGQGSGD